VLHPPFYLARPGAATSARRADPRRASPEGSLLPETSRGSPESARSSTQGFAARDECD
jgi:hypothetical protein